MDDQSKNVTEFLELLQDLQNKSLEKLHLAFLKRGALGIKSYISLSRRPCHYGSEEFSGVISVGLLVRVVQTEELEFDTSVWWNQKEWLIKTEAARYSDEKDGMDVIRELPIQRTNKLTDCIKTIQSDMLELSKWSDLADIGPS